MFYAHFVLAKKGPLARIWLAAHWDKKLTKAHVFETNIEKSVDGILQPKVKMALRTSGHLLLGVVRIYSRKAKYLLADCNEAFVKIKMAFRPGMVDLPEEHREAAVTAITLPEVFHDFDTAMPELKDVDIEAQFSLNQSRAEEITMREDYGSLSLVTHDQGFGDMSFDAEPPELMRHGSSMEPSLDQGHMLFSDGPGIETGLEQKEKEPVPGTSSTVQPMDIDTPIRDDGFGGHLGQDIISGGLFEGGLFDEAPMGEVPVPEVSGGGGIGGIGGVGSGSGGATLTEQQESGAAMGSGGGVGASGVGTGGVGAASVHDDSDDDTGADRFGGPASPMGGGMSSSTDGSRPTTPAAIGEEPGEGRAASVASRRFTPAPPATIPEEHAMDVIEEPPPLQDQTTLLHDEEESFALAPVDASALKGFTKAKRKRKLIVDEVKNISGEEMKAQLSDTSDIITTLDLAPPTKRLMHWKETGGVEKLFALPGRPIPARVLFKNYQRHLTSKSYDHEDFGRLGAEEDGMPLEQVRDAPEAADAAHFEQSMLAKRMSRKRKAAQDDEVPSKVQVLGQAPQTPSSEDPNAAGVCAETVESSVVGIPASVPPAESPLGPEVSLPPPDVSASDLGSVLPSIDSSETAAGGAGGAGGAAASGGNETPSLIAEMPQIAPAEVSSLLGGTTEDEAQSSSLPAPPPPSPPPPPQPSSQATPAPTPAALLRPDESPAELPTTDLPQMENMGYDQAQHQVSYMGYDDVHHPPAHTPGAISERGPATPWNHEDYEFPPSVGPQEEQQVDETYEQFEERVLNKRAAHMYHVIKSKLDIKERLTLAEMAYKNSRKQAAQKFYTLLVLKKFQVLELNQECSYADIVVTKGPKWENPAL